MPRNYPVLEPSCWNKKYREYVSAKEVAEKVRVRDFRDIQENITDYHNFSPNYYDSIVTNSHQHPRGAYNPIKPYKQPEVQSFFNKNYNKTAFYFGSKRYTRANCPTLGENWV